MDTANIWKEYQAAGLHVFPTKDKRPTVPSWKALPENLQFNGQGAMACGSLSGGLEVVDIDAKNDPQLIDNLQKAFEAFSVELPDDMVYQTTVNGGMHLIYRTNFSEGNQVLARNADGKALIETRAGGGYIVVAPTPGYQIKRGRLTAIPLLEDQDRENLFAACRSLNEKVEEVKPRFTQPMTSGGLAPWEDFNLRGEVDDILQLHGWRYIRKIGDNLHYTRPGKDVGTSATWSESKRLFYVFTSSTEFEPSKAYPASAVYAYLETGKDFSEAARQLSRMGYGERATTITTNDWRDLQVITEPAEDPAIITIGKSPVATLGNYSQVIGKKKSRKSLFMTWLISQYGGDISNDVLYFDTEQGKRHVWKMMDRITRLTDCTVGTFYLRGKTPAERRALIKTIVAEYPTRPKLIIIDGIRDLLSNINDPDQVSELLTWLEKLTLENNLHVVNVLHMNKTDNNARGHLGSELLNKAEITIELERDEQADCTLVRCESSRDIPFDPFAFRHDAEGLPEIVSMPAGGKVLPEDEQKKRLRFVFQDGGELMKYADVWQGIRTHFEVGTVKAKNLTAQFNRAGWIVKNSTTGRDVFYKIML